MHTHPTRERPCGCVVGATTTFHRCPEAQELWARFVQLASYAKMATVEYKAYREHIDRARRTG